VAAVDDVLAACQKHNGDVYPVVGHDGGCARFVSDMFKEAGQGAIFPWSSSVPAIVASWPATRVLTRNSTPLASMKMLASMGDLIVFGSDEHIGVMAGNGMVWNTNGGGGVNKVQLQDVSAIGTLSGGDFSRILRTELSLSKGTDVVGNLVNPIADAAGGIAGGIFGAMFGWVPTFALNAGILLFAAALVFLGLREVVSGAE
jgi:hypothetical protein